VKSKVLIDIFCGQERGDWINPGLVARLFESMSESRNDRPALSFKLTFGVKPIDRARNESVRHFLTTDCTWLVMIDNDTYPPENFLNVIVEAERDGKFIVGLPCPMLSKAGVTFNVAHTTDHADLAACMNYLPPGWTKVDYTGTGMIAIRRCVLEAVRAPWFSFTPTMGEDFNFSRMAREAGFQVWTHGNFACDHLHTYSLLELLKATRGPASAHNAENSVALKIATGDHCQ
jgi:hypothetical protein